jgi:hypothetical protein
MSEHDLTLRLILRNQQLLMRSQSELIKQLPALPNKERAPVVMRLLSDLEAQSRSTDRFVNAMEGNYQGSKQ